MGRKTTYSRENAQEHISDSGKMRTRITLVGYDTYERPVIFKKGHKNAVSSHKTQDILPRSIKSIFQLLVWLIKIFIV